MAQCNPNGMFKNEAMNSEKLLYHQIIMLIANTQTQLLESRIATGDNTENALDWAGEYKGTLALP